MRIDWMQKHVPDSMLKKGWGKWTDADWNKVAELATSLIEARQATMPEPFREV